MGGLSVTLEVKILTLLPGMQIKVLMLGLSLLIVRSINTWQIIKLY